jgi:putative GTP pyrophosphokinase
MPEFDQVWRSNPEKTKSQFLEQEPNYKELCGEVEHILKKKLKNSGIEIATISSRAKTWKSFWEKIEKKEYANPFEEVSDFSGARVVHLYAQDAEKIEEIIRNEFEILETVNKIDKNGESKFGYSAIHFIVKLNRNTSGARYDELKNLCCEIQIRTVLQDAWAIIEHHLGYKSVIPSALKRKLNGLAGLLEVADDQFEQIKSAREEYISSVFKSKKNIDDFLKNELNRDTFSEYFKWKYNGNDLGEKSFDILSRFFGKFNTLSDLDSMIEKGEKIIKDTSLDKNQQLSISNNLIRRILVSIYLADPELEVGFIPEIKQIIEDHKSKE